MATTREKARRFLDAYEGARKMVPALFPEGSGCPSEDQYDVIRDYLSEHPADEGDPAPVEAMLREAGVQVHPGGFGCCEITFSGRHASGKLTVNLSMTVGQVRRLIAGLGV